MTMHLMTITRQRYVNESLASQKLRIPYVKYNEKLEKYPRNTSFEKCGLLLVEMQRPNCPDGCSIEHKIAATHQSSCWNRLANFIG